MELNYSIIKPLIISEVIDGNQIKLKFKAENQETPMDAIAIVMPSQDEMMKNVAKQGAKTAATSMGIRAVFGAIGSFFGGFFGSAASMAGSAVSSAATQNSMSQEKIMKTEMTQEAKETAIVNCFMNFQTMYKWENEKWSFQNPSPQ
ncbi:MAG: hypothetical protein H6598_06465 [Flavobacteriales bacterium]|nr:hypothetical protein [Flavobacteriales bacterium]